MRAHSLPSLRSTLAALLAVAFVPLALACGDDDADPDAGPTDAGPTADGGADAGPRDAGEDGGGGDGDDDFDGARELRAGAAAGMGVIGTEGDLDHYRFEGTAGEWVRIAVDANPDGMDTLLDSYVTLFDSARVQLAQNDDAVPTSSPDSEIIILLPSTGTYYVRVEDAAAATGGTPRGGRELTYALSYALVNVGASDVTRDRETGDDAASAAGAGFSSGGANLTVGTFRDGMDVDVYAMTVVADGRLTSYLMPWGTDGYGSTSSAGRVWLTDQTGATVIGRIDNRIAGWGTLNVPVTRGSYLLFLEHPGTAPGANDFYVVKSFRSRTDNAPELMEGTNDTLAGAEALALSTDAVRAAFLLARLPDGDVDYFSFDVMAGERASVACGAENSGSGVRGLSVEIRDATDAVLATASETPPSNAYIADGMVPGAGTFYVRLTKASQDPEVTGDWVRCGVRAFRP